ncbi:MAG: 1-acyl-sn-glycerol-3-phosphate acyltransferase [Acidimicrobiia bacterium]
MAKTYLRLGEHLHSPGDALAIYLLDAATDYEESMLLDWLRSEVDGHFLTSRIRSSRRPNRAGPETLDDILDANPGGYLIPLRVLWLPPEREGRRSVRWSDLVRLGDPRDPRAARARLIGAFRKGRVATISGKGEYLSVLVAGYEESDVLEGLTAFITRRAWRALDVEERTLRGNRYKTPRFVSEAISTRRDFRDDVIRLGAEKGLNPDRAEARADAYLREIAAKHSPLVIDLIANAIHKLYRQGYGEIRYDPAQIRRIARLGQANPIVFLPSHRSNLDRLSLQFMLWENDLPPNHTAGGINLNFFPIGPLLRRTGVFFIRRSFRDNPLYKAVLQHYLDYLIEKRFSLEWYLEGGRSRSGRLLPPRLGLLNYVVDAQRRGKADDIVLIPVSIAYDQIQDVPDYAREAQGKSKEKESIGWLVRSVRSMRRRYGDIHIRFGEPLSTGSWKGDTESDEPSIDVQKLGFEVMYRISQVTPVTPTAVLSVALLAERGKAQTADHLAGHCRALQLFLEARSIPTTEPLVFGDPGRVAQILDRLAEHDNVSSHEALERRVFWCDDEQMIRISYYRNMIVHYFLNRSIAEIALAGLVEDPNLSVASFNERALELRDLLKFEFFFSEKDEFLERLAAEIEIDVPGWKNMLLTSGPAEVLEKLDRKVAGWALLPFFDAYQIIGDELESLQRPYNEKRFLKDSLDRARMYRIEDATITGESASQVLFKSALRLAENRNLLDDSPGAESRRADFASRIRETRRLANELTPGR